MSAFTDISPEGFVRTLEAAVVADDASRAKQNAHALGLNARPGAGWGDRAAARARP